MKKHQSTSTHIFLAIILLLMLGMFLGAALIVGTPILNLGSPTATVGSSFYYTFNTPGILYEADSMEHSTSPYWWLNSGGELHINNFTAGTLAGNAVSALSRWAPLYTQNNPTDTDSGTHPQNLFRLVTRSLWGDARQESMFMVLTDNFSTSPNRNASNGLLLMHRYQDAGQTLYYAGVRVDGQAVIKKKYKGTYYTMAHTAVFPGTYNGWQDNQNLIPHRQWLTLRSETKENADGSVTISLFMRKLGESGFTKILEATDRGQYDGTQPITSKGYAGIRTDFMDVRFENYRIQEI